ncbi:MAG: FAD-binding protein [Rickettsiales bacterium]|nr:FAD-binding protein [Pseudomonadota bacterium]MDA0967291.1 FAD-binding protein [Pseudomonadota bacterium]MDG4544048.1 FAD-binding protein [Rickettsiales bacterium]MDG4546258.1 FAD-binding protein [Rickettsiales bacterium]MDG4548372.1 FAD-binding protein [Rickettsiales bacterium]
MTVLVIAEHDNNNLKASTLNTITAGAKLGSVEVLVAGSGCSSVAEEASKINGVSKVLKADDAAYENALAENLAALIKEIAPNYSHILAPSNTFGKNFMPRVAALLDVCQITDVLEVVSEDTFKRPIYAGNAIATVQTSDSIKILTVRTTAFEKASQGGSASIEEISSKGDSGLSSFVKLEGSGSTGPDLSSSRAVISGGRGMASKDNFILIEKVAAKINDCAIGASRAAVDAGYISNDYQVGQTGKIVAPELYIAVGISGAIQHLAGMKDSKIIVAINKDENAPIFEVADYGLVADLFDVLPQMEQLL